MLRGFEVQISRDLAVSIEEVKEFCGGVMKFKFL